MPPTQSAYWPNWYRLLPVVSWYLAVSFHTSHNTRWFSDPKTQQDSALLFACPSSSPTFFASCFGSDTGLSTHYLPNLLSWSLPCLSCSSYAFVSSLSITTPTTLFLIRSRSSLTLTPISFGNGLTFLVICSSLLHSVPSEPSSLMSLLNHHFSSSF